MPTSCPPQYVSQNIIHGSAQAVLYDLEAQITGATAHTRRSRLSLVCPAETLSRRRIRQLTKASSSLRAWDPDAHTR